MLVRLVGLQRRGLNSGGVGLTCSKGEPLPVAFGFSHLQWGWGLPVARGSAFNPGEAEVGVASSEPRVLPVFELATGAETLDLQPIQVKRQTEGETTVTPRHKLK